MESSNNGTLFSTSKAQVFLLASCKSDPNSSMIYNKMPTLNMLTVSHVYIRNILLNKWLRKFLLPSFLGSQTEHTYPKAQNLIHGKKMRKIDSKQSMKIKSYVII